MSRRRYIIALSCAFAVMVATAVGSLVCGSVNIPLEDIFRILTGGTPEKATWGHIVMEIRLPAIITAVMAGVSLSVAGLLMQTVFANPLAGPSIMGVSSGAGLGVAVVVLLIGNTTGAVVGGAIVGAMAVVIVLVLLASILRSGVMLLIVGILLSYLTSSAITLMNFAATEHAERHHTGVDLQDHY